MTEKQLKEARFLENDIWNYKRDIEDIDKILLDFDSFGSEVTFKRNSDGFSRGFGSKKFKFKEDLQVILNNLKIQLKEDLRKMETKFKEL